MWKWLFLRWFAPFVLAFAAVAPACPPPLRSRPYDFGPQIYFMHVNFQVVGGAQFDVLQQLPAPCNGFFVVSMNKLANSLFMSLKPTNRNNPTASAPIVPNGNEEWFPLTAQQLAGVNYWSFLRFKEPVNQIYLSSGSESGTATVLTLACIVDDIVYVSGGMWT